MRHSWLTLFFLLNQPVLPCKFQCRIDFWHIILLGIDLMQSILGNICEKHFVGVPWGTWDRLLQKKKDKKKSSYGNA